MVNDRSSGFVVSCAWLVHIARGQGFCVASVESSVFNKVALVPPPLDSCSTLLLRAKPVFYATNGNFVVVVVQGSWCRCKVVVACRFSLLGGRTIVCPSSGSVLIFLRLSAGQLLCQALAGYGAVVGTLSRLVGDRMENGSIRTGVKRRSHLRRRSLGRGTPPGVIWSSVRESLVEVFRQGGTAVRSTSSNRDCAVISSSNAHQRNRLSLFLL